jgi:hypothetical protein
MASLLELLINYHAHNFGVTLDATDGSGQFYPINSVLMILLFLCFVITFT